MTSIPNSLTEAGPWPDHLQLPFQDNVPVKNSLEHLQSVILTDAIGPVVKKLYPEGHYFIGQDCGIYWRLTEPPERGVKAPDWYFVPDVPATLQGEARRSYVLWKEVMSPTLVVEYVSGDGSEERARTPWEGKFWVYEKAIRAAFYAIWEPLIPRLEVYHLVDNAYQPLSPNARGHFEIGPLQVELGLWEGQVANQERTWLRCWSLEGELLPTGWENSEREKREKELALWQAEQERLRRTEAEQQAMQERVQREQAERKAEEAQRLAQVLAERLRAAGIDPDAI
ncbi:MAG: Uma2 family endonuclease [Gemmataceae bacterium]|nr:Uma2 family endonuclease [Gemmataceae bacterium]